jgi:hypothetical protein
MRPPREVALLFGCRAIFCGSAHLVLDVTYEVAEFVYRHSAHGLPELPHPVRHLIWVKCWVFRHATMYGQTQGSFQIGPLRFFKPGQ